VRKRVVTPKYIRGYQGKADDVEDIGETFITYDRGILRRGLIYDVEDIRERVMTSRNIEKRFTI
jgi:hypothetical protein